ncbi:hypothetical protein ACQPZ8_37430 [Actinomadura nitritigenes]|uniref:hypothetical protein n=1 Tax=Actinomadura nitritigenes TaxID=134602 RepID=UPI003D94F057
MTPEAEELQRLAVAAAEMVDDLDAQRAREAAEFRAGYELGFAAGREVGYAQAEWDMHRAWAALAAKVRAWAGRPTWAELKRRRAA